jgi:hypothetical protein
MVLIILYQNIYILDNLSSVNDQPLIVNLSKESMMRLLPEPKYLIAPPLQQFN